MSIADKIIENEKKPKYEVDDIGIGIADTLDYIAARILKINYDAYRQGEEGLLHKRADGNIYIGDRDVEENARNIYKLAHVDRVIHNYEVPKIWAIVKKNVPELDESKIIIDDYTYWDIENGCMVRSDKKLVSI